MFLAYKSEKICSPHSLQPQSHNCEHFQTIVNRHGCFIHVYQPSLPHQSNFRTHVNLHSQNKPLLILISTCVLPPERNADVHLHDYINWTSRLRSFRATFWINNAKERGAVRPAGAEWEEKGRKTVTFCPSFLSTPRRIERVFGTGAFRLSAQHTRVWACILYYRLRTGCSLSLSASSFAFWTAIGSKGHWWVKCDRWQ